MGVHDVGDAHHRNYGRVVLHRHDHGPHVMVEAECERVSCVHQRVRCQLARDKLDIGDKVCQTVFHEVVTDELAGERCALRFGRECLRV